MHAVTGKTSQVPIVVERPEVDDVARFPGQLPRNAPRGEEQLLVRVRLACVVRRGSRVEVEGDDATTRVHVDAELGRPAEDRRLLLAAPQPLREWRPHVRLVRLRSEHADRSVRVVVANSSARGISRHPAADDQVPIRGHLAPILAAVGYAL